MKKKQQHKKMKTNKRQQNNKKKKNNNKWPHPTLIGIYSHSRYFGMFDCDIESYRDNAGYCRIHSLFKLLIVSFPAYFQKHSNPATFWKYFQNLAGFERFWNIGWDDFPRSRNIWKIRIFWKFWQFAGSFKSFRVLIKHCNVWKVFATKPVEFPDIPNWNLSTLQCLNRSIKNFAMF